MAEHGASACTRTSCGSVKGRGPRRRPVWVPDSHGPPVAVNPCVPPPGARGSGHPWTAPGTS
jgi:hypothetical protein